MNTDQEILNIVAYQLSTSVHALSLETTLHELNVDSLDAVELAMAIEDKYDINVPDEDLAKFKTVGDIVAYIKEKQ